MDMEMFGHRITLMLELVVLAEQLFHKKFKMMERSLKGTDGIKESMVMPTL